MPSPVTRPITVSSEHRYVCRIAHHVFLCVRAVDQAGNAGPRSQPVSVTTKGFAIPRNVQAAGGEQKITLTWAANTEPELVGYEILRYTDPTQATPDRVFSSILTTYVDTVTADQPFVYRVRAVGPSNVKSELSAPTLPRPWNLRLFWQPRAMCRQEGGINRLPSPGQPIQKQN